MAPTAYFSSVLGNVTDVNAEVRGWVSSGSDRGSIDILFTSIITILLCTWVSVLPNVPSADGKWYHPMLEKLWLTMIGFLGPDLIFAMAYGQLASARRSVKMFRENPAYCKNEKWTYSYAFFLDMGGIHLTSLDYPKGFPINSEQLFYLVKNGHVDFPDMEKMDIQERNAKDILSRVITVWQVFWFLVLEAQRLHDGLPITTLEVTALVFAFIMIGTSICWFYKPSISCPRHISTKANRSIESIREYAKHNTHAQLGDEWHRTPLDFISRRPFAIDCHWSYYRRLSELIHFPGLVRSIRTRPWDQIPSDIWHPPTDEPLYLAFGTIILAGFSVSLVCCWNFYFPTDVERKMWRVISVYLCIYSCMGGLLYFHAALQWNHHRRKETSAKMGQPTTHFQAVSRRHTLKIQPAAHVETGSSGVHPTERNREPSSESSLHTALSSISKTLQPWRNISVDGDPGNAIPIRVNFPWMLFTILYIFGRVFIYVEDLMSLRSQPAGVYISVNRFLPFLG